MKWNFSKVVVWSCNSRVLLSPQNADILNTAVLTGQPVNFPLKVLAVESDGSVTDVTNATSCRTTEEEVLKVGGLQGGTFLEEVVCVRNS